MRAPLTQVGIAAVLAILAIPRAQGQAAPSAPVPDPMLGAAKAASDYMRAMLTTAGEQMSDADYAFRPTPDVRTFGQLLAHVAESNYQFCSSVLGEAQPVRDVEKTVTARDDIRRVLAGSFDYCDRAYAAVEGNRTGPTASFHGESLPVLVVLVFRTHHAALHYGNVITYMRLRGKVPPSTASSSERGDQ